jgi:hypothetical protein
VKAFIKARSKLIYYVIDKTIAEWRAIKDFTDAINSGDEDLFEFKEAIKYLCECELLLYFRLLCKHWILSFYLRKEPLSLSLFHLRWLLNGLIII